ncbi:MAG: hypothetical protein AAEI08_05530 [Gammaproteobacteria bacterium]
MAKKLDVGIPFPTLHMNLASGGYITLPGDVDSAYMILLFYRGHW